MKLHFANDRPAARYDLARPTAPLAPKSACRLPFVACELTRVDRPPAGPGWLHEIKHDGFRILAWKQGEGVQVWSRRGADFTDRFARIADAVRGLSVDEAMIDGEAVIFQDDGRSDFHALLIKRGWEEAAFVAFEHVLATTFAPRFSGGYPARLGPDGAAIQASRCRPA